MVTVITQTAVVLGVVVLGLAYEFQEELFDDGRGDSLIDLVCLVGDLVGLRRGASIRVGGVLVPHVYKHGGVS